MRMKSCHLSRRRRSIDDDDAAEGCSSCIHAIITSQLCYSFLSLVQLLLLCWLTLLPFASATCTQTDTLAYNDGGSSGRGILVNPSNHYVIQSWTGMQLSYRPQTASSPWSGLGRYLYGAPSGYAPAGASFLYDISEDIVANHRVFIADHGATVPAIHVYDINAATAYTLNTGSLVLQSPRAIDYDTTNKRLYVMDNSSPVRLLSIDTTTPSNSFDYALGNTLGWSQGQCSGLCSDATNGWIYTTCWGYSKIWRVNMQSSAGTATSSLYYYQLGEQPNECVVDTANQVLYVSLLGSTSNIRVFQIGGSTSLLPVSGGTLSMGSGIDYQLAWDAYNARLWVAGVSQTWAMQVYCNDATLTGLSVSAGTLTPAFASDIFVYTAPMASTSTITATQRSTSGYVLSVANYVSTASRPASGSYAALTSGTASSNFLLKLTTAIVSVQVVSPNGAITRYYDVHIPVSTVATFSALAVKYGSGYSSTATLTPAFASTTYSYLATLPIGTTSLEFATSYTNPNSWNQLYRVNSGTTYGFTGTTVVSMVLGDYVYLTCVAQDQSTTGVYTIRMVSNVATLSGLSLDVATSMTPAFASGTYSYKVGVPAITSAVLTATLTHSLATMTLKRDLTTLGSPSSGVGFTASGLVVSTSQLIVTVTAQDGTTTLTYTLTLKSNIAKVVTWTTSNPTGTWQVAFSSTTYSYVVGVPRTTTSIQLLATVSESHSTMQRCTNSAGCASLPTNTLTSALTMTMGTQFEITVTAEDGVASQTYTITMRGSDSDLSTLTFSVGTLTPAFASTTYAYKLSMAPTVTSLTLTPTLLHSAATVWRATNGGVYVTTTNGAASAAITVAVSTDTLKVKGIAEDGWHTSNYSIVLVSNVDTLSSASITTYTLIPTFSTAQHSYIVSVPVGTTSITMSATMTSGYSTLTRGINNASYTSMTNGSSTPISSLSLNDAVWIKIVAQSNLSADTLYYTFTIKSNDAHLTGLTFSQGTLSPSFSGSTLTYQLRMSPSISSMTLTATKSDASLLQYQRNTGGYITLTSGTPSASLTTAVSTDTLTLRSTAADTSTNVTYTITLISTESKATSITAVPSALYPTFASATTSYSLGMAVAASSLQLTVVPTSNYYSGLHYSIDGGSTWTPMSANTATTINSITVGTTVVRVRIIAQDTVTSTQYLISPKSDDCTLSSLAFTAPTPTPDFSPAFAASTLSYTFLVVDSNPISLNASYAANSVQSMDYSVNGGTTWTPLSQGVQVSGISITPGSTVVQVRVIAAYGGATNIYSTGIQGPTTDSRLSAMSVTLDTVPVSLSPSFASNTLSYTVTSSSASTVGVVVSATPSSGSAHSMSYSTDGSTFTAISPYTNPTPSLTVTVGSGSVWIQVVSQDQAYSRQYRIDIVSSLATLGSLMFSGSSLVGGFSSGTQSYIVGCTPGSSSINLTATASNSHVSLVEASWQGVTTPMTSGSSVVISGISVGTASLLTIRVVAQDTTTELTYSLQLYSNDASLSALSCNTGVLNPIFTAGTLSYKLGLDPTTTSLSCTATQTLSGAISALDWQIDSGGWLSLTSGVAPTVQTVSVASSIIYFRVKAQDTATSNIYIVTLKSNDARLKNVTWSGGASYPTFNNQTTSYALGCVGSTGSNVNVRLTATAISPVAFAIDYSFDTGSSWQSVGTSGVQTGLISVTIGTTMLWIRVTASDLSTMLTYSYAVELDDADLSSLTFTAIGAILSPAAFLSTTRTYSLTVINGDPIIVTPTTKGSVVTSLDGSNDGSVFTALTSGAGWTVGVIPDTTTLTIRIVAQYGGHTEQYQITILQASHDARLSSFIVKESGTIRTLRPTPFVTSTLDYQISSANLPSSNITVTVVPFTGVYLIEWSIDSISWTSMNPLGDTTPSESLSVGTGFMLVRVTAADHGTTMVYSITVQSSVATLSNITIVNDGILTSSFNSAQSSYIVSMAPTQSILSLISTTTHSMSTFTVIDGHGFSTTGVSGVEIDLTNVVVGGPVITIHIIAQDGTISQYTLAPKSNDPSLTSLSFTGGTLFPSSLSIGVYSYSLGCVGTIGSSASITVTAVPTATGSTMQLTIDNGVHYTTLSSGTSSGSKSLVIGSGVVSVLITAPDGYTSQPYTVSVLLDDAELSNLFATVTYSNLAPAFTTGQRQYQLTVIDATPLTLTAVTRGALVTSLEGSVDGGAFVPLTSGSAWTNIPITPGLSVITFKIVAQYGGHSEQYTISVLQASGDATLSSLQVRETGHLLSLSPSFQAMTYGYAVASSALPSTSITVTVVTSLDVWKVEWSLDGSTFTLITLTAGSYVTPSASISCGNGRITIRVTAADHASTKDYYVDMLSDVATLSSLVMVSGGTVVGTFSPSTLNYKISMHPGLTMPLSFITTSTSSFATITLDWNNTLSVVTSGTQYDMTALVVGSTTPLNLVVTPQSGTTQTYSLLLTEDDARLSSLSCNTGVMLGTFSSGTFSSYWSLDPATTTIACVATSLRSSVSLIEWQINSGSYVTITSGSLSTARPINIATATVLTFRVTAQDTVTQLFYTLALKSNDTRLNSISFNNGAAIFPSFSSDVTSYSIGLVGSTGDPKTVQFTAVPLSPTTTALNYSIDGTTWTPFASGVATADIGVTIGVTQLQVRVIAADGISTGIYAFAIQLDNANLSSLSITAIDSILTPNFSPTVRDYTLIVINSNPITIGAVTSDVVKSLEGSTGSSYSPLSSGVDWTNVTVVPGITTITIRVTAQYGGHIELYQIHVQLAASDSSLSALDIQLDGTAVTLLPSLAFGQLMYGVGAASNGNVSMNFHAAANSLVAFGIDYKRVDDSGWLTLPISGDSIPLLMSVGGSILEIRVTAQDRTTSRYLISVLSNKVIVSGLMTQPPTIESFAPNSTLYTVLAPFGRSNFNFTITLPKTMSKMEYSVDGGIIFSTMTASSIDSNFNQFPSSVFAVLVGTAQDADLRLRVTSPDMVSSKEFTIQFLCTDDSLVSLLIDAGSLTPVFISSTLNYQSLVPSAATATTFTVVSRALGSNIEYQLKPTSPTDIIPWSSLISSIPSSSIAIRPGIDTLSVRVIAEDGITQQIYSIKFTPNDACETVGLCQSGGTCVADYSPTATRPYKCNCANGFSGLNCENSYADGVNQKLQQTGGDSGMTTGDSTDPCITANPCLNNGQCISTRNVNGTIVFVLCDCPLGYFGPFCGSVIIDCQDCIVTWSKPKNVTLYAISMEYLSIVELANRNIDFNLTTVAKSAAGLTLDQAWPSSVQQATTYDRIHLELPAVRPSEVASSDGGSGNWSDSGVNRRLLGVVTSVSKGYLGLEASLQLPEGFIYTSPVLHGLLFFTDSSCLDVGTFGSDGDGGCLPCPEGAYCPGGDRAWPQAGYWSTNERAVPEKCSIPDACLGVSASASFGLTQDGTKDTQQCAIGYTSITCTVCDSGYYSTEGRCWACGDSTPYLVVMILVFFGIMCTVAVCIAIFRPQRLAQLVSAFILLQGVVVVGKSGARGLKSSPASEMISNVFNTLSVINLDLECFRPGCTSFSPSFIVFYFATVVLMIFTGCLFIIACLVRHWYLSRKEYSEARRLGLTASTRAKSTRKAARLAAKPERGVRGALKIEVPKDVQRIDFLSRTSSSQPTVEMAVEVELQSLRNENANDTSTTPIDRVTSTKLNTPIAWSDSNTTTKKPNLTKLKSNTNGDLIRNRTFVPKQARSETFRRIIHSMFILGAIFYLRLTSLSLKMFDCTQTVGVPDNVTADGRYLYDDAESKEMHSYLTADLRIRCLVGAHTGGVIFALFFLIFISLLYPVYALILLTRTFAGQHSTGCVKYLVRAFPCCRGAGYHRKLHRPASLQVAAASEEDVAEAKDGHQAQATQIQIEMYGYLFRGLRPALYYYRIALYPLQFLYAAMSTFYPGQPLTTFVLGAGSAIQTLYIVIYLPFTSWTFNTVSTLASLATVGHAVLMLGLIGGDTLFSLMIPLASVGVVILVVLLSRKQLSSMFEQCHITLAEAEMDSVEAEAEEERERQEDELDDSEDDDDDDDDEESVAAAEAEQPSDVVKLNVASSDALEIVRPAAKIERGAMSSIDPPSARSGRTVNAPILAVLDVDEDGGTTDLLASSQQQPYPLHTPSEHTEDGVIMHTAPSPPGPAIPTTSSSESSSTVAVNEHKLASSLSSNSLPLTIRHDENLNSLMDATIPHSDDQIEPTSKSHSKRTTATLVVVDVSPPGSPNQSPVNQSPSSEVVSSPLVASTTIPLSNALKPPTKSGASKPSPGQTRITLKPKVASRG